MVRPNNPTPLEPENEMTNRVLLHHANSTRREWLRVAAFDTGSEAARTKADYFRALEALHLGLIVAKQLA